MILGITATELAQKIVVTLMAKPISDGISKIVKVGADKIAKNSPEDNVAKALEKALDKVSPDNEFWKNDVLRQIEEVIQILIRILDNPRYTDNHPLPNYIDKKTIDCFKDCLKEDTKAWNYIQDLHYEDILQKLRTTIEEIDKRTKRIETNTEKTDERTQRIEDNTEETKIDVKQIKETLSNVIVLSNCHFLTPCPPKADASNVIGRDEDLKTLWEMLEKNTHVILTGFGGIGKTVLAQRLYHEYGSQFDEVAWITYQGDLKKSFVSCINAIQIPEDCRTEEKQWEFMERNLRNDGKKKLIVIDNVDNIADEQLQALTGWYETIVLLTSRLPELEGYEEHILPSLSKEDCIALFNHYLKGRTATHEQAARFAELAYWHTLTIELLAKGALQKKNLDAYYDEVKKGFDLVDKVKYHNEEDTIEHHLHALYDMQKRTPKEKEVLNALAVLPERCECEREELECWFGFKESDWHDLMRDGWLAFEATSQLYSLHPLVRTIVRFDFQEDEQNNKTIAPGNIADRLLEYCERHEWYSISQSSQSLLRRSYILDSALVASSQKEIGGASLWNNIKSCRYDVKVVTEALNYYNEASNYLCKAIEKFCAKYPFSVITNDNIDGFCNFQSYYNKALEYYDKANDVFDTKFPETDSTYNNDSLVCNLRDAKKSVECSLKKFESLIKTYKT